MTKRIFRSICFVAISVFLASIALFMGVLYRYFSDAQQSQLRMQTALAAQGVSNEGSKYLDGLESEHFRITWIGQDGSVLYDNKSDTAQMENHLERKEIVQALKEGFGESSRYSFTILERSYYCAQRLDDGTVLRLSTAQATMPMLLFSMAQPIGIIVIIALILSMVLASQLSKHIVKPLNELNLDEPLRNEGYDELSPLLHRIDKQQHKIDKQRSELLRKQREFETVTTGMTQGIVLLNGKKQILSINPYAARLFHSDQNCVGASILAIDRSLELQELLNQSVKGMHAEKVMTLTGGFYQFEASPVMLDNEVAGIVLLILDVTEKEKVEQIRREFTANVSHELKTPLHTISGCAELLTKGMVKKEDITKFSKQIYQESQRLIHLVEDIIKLSRLDEGMEDMKREDVDLYLLALQTVESLSDAAEKAAVKVTLEGDNAVINGVVQMLQGIIYNLCENAIKYNRKNGSVTITIEDEESVAKLMVADTGIGIPAEDTERIFERFYRVDKSRSKDIGGTGLGLSIVKHAARLHHAQIAVESTVNEGTTITVSFPKNELL